MLLRGNAVLRKLGSLRRSLGFRLYRRAESGIIARFHTLYYWRSSQGGTWRDTHWLGTPTLKCPMDMWAYQEILWNMRPDLIIETGTFRGGSALFLATICDLTNSGHIVSIDIEERDGLPKHDRITYLTGSSISSEIVSEVTQMAEGMETVMVILDSAHEKDHVLNEISAYSPLVTLGSLLVVEDTHLNGHPIRSGFGPGPMEAVEDFMVGNSSFEVDPIGSKFLMTFNPGGYLRRVNEA